MKHRVATSPSSLETYSWNKSPVELIHGSTAICVARICGNIVIMFSVLRPSTSSSSQPAQESSTPFLTAILPGVSRAARTGLGFTTRKLFSVLERHRGPCSASISCRNDCKHTLCTNIIAWASTSTRGGEYDKHEYKDTEHSPQQHRPWENDDLFPVNWRFAISSYSLYLFMFL